MKTMFRCIMAALALASSGVAQQVCNFPVQDDGFAAAACCTPAQAHAPNLPNIPAFINILGIWSVREGLTISPPQGGPNQVCLPLPGLFPFVDVTLSAPTRTTCTTFAITITVAARPPALSPVFSTTVTATYMSTWLERRVGSVLMGQVWRFHISDDLTWATSQTAGTDPPCLTQFALVHLVGTLDYACVEDPPPPGQSTPVMGWHARLNLQHMCDIIEHKTGSPRPGPFHPTRDYTLAAPSPHSTVDIRLSLRLPAHTQRVPASKFVTSATATGQLPDWGSPGV